MLWFSFTLDAIGPARCDLSVIGDARKTSGHWDDNGRRPSRDSPGRKESDIAEMHQVSQRKRPWRGPSGRKESDLLEIKNFWKVVFGHVPNAAVCLWEMVCAGRFARSGLGV